MRMEFLVFGRCAAFVLMCLLTSLILVQGDEFSTDISSYTKNSSTNDKTHSSEETLTVTPPLESSFGIENASWLSPQSLVYHPNVLQPTPQISTTRHSSPTHQTVSSHVPEVHSSPYDNGNITLKTSESSDIAIEPASFISPSNTVRQLSTDTFPTIIPNNSIAKTSDGVSSDLYSHFHTPLMSLLVASPSVASHPEATTIPPSLDSSSVSPSHVPPSLSTNNETPSQETTTLPADAEHKKLLMLVLRAEDCSRLSKEEFEKMLGQLMTKFGFADSIPEVSNAKCYSHLNINLTIGHSPTLRFLPNMDGRNNITVDVLNRTFRIVKLERIDLKLAKAKSSNSSHVIAQVESHECVVYISLGVGIVMTLLITIIICCIKCCCLRKSRKRFSTGAKCTHMRLRPEDYTLTPIPRPTSLYVDYYRGSADIYSTTSAGSIASTTPNADKGVVQPFDTSIVPLEDTSTFPADASRDPSIESAPAQSDMKTFNIHNFANKSLRGAATDSKEHLNPKQSSRKIEPKKVGVTNPTFQRY